MAALTILYATARQRNLPGLPTRFDAGIWSAQPIYQAQLGKEIT
jgi:hypothetical protein